MPVGDDRLKQFRSPFSFPSGTTLFSPESLSVPSSQFGVLGASTRPEPTLKISRKVKVPKIIGRTVRL